MKLSGGTKVEMRRRRRRNRGGDREIRGGRRRRNKGGVRKIREGRRRCPCILVGHLVRATRGSAEA